MPSYIRHPSSIHIQRENRPVEGGDGNYLPLEEKTWLQKSASEAEDSIRKLTASAATIAGDGHRNASLELVQSA